MSRGIVSQKKFSRKKRKQSFRKMLNRSGVSVPEFKISQKLKNILSR
jgi:flagellar basal body P-ring protein FlgI